MYFHIYKLGVSFIQSMKQFFSRFYYCYYYFIFLFFLLRHGNSWNERTGQTTYLVVIHPQAFIKLSSAG
jgi:hypothetical protein